MRPKPVHLLNSVSALPGIKINVSPIDFYPIAQMQMSRFNGEIFLPFGPVLSARSPACDSYSAASARSRSGNPRRSHTPTSASPSASIRASS